jgi:hypothetical protein
MFLSREVAGLAPRSAGGGEGESVLTGADVPCRADRDSDVEPLADGDLFVADDHPSGSGGEGVDVFDLVCPVVVADSLPVSG